MFCVCKVNNLIKEGNGFGFYDFDLKTPSLGVILVE